MTCQSSRLTSEMILMNPLDIFFIQYIFSDSVLYSRKSARHSVNFIQQIKLSLAGLQDEAPLYQFYYKAVNTTKHLLVLLEISKSFKVKYYIAHSRAICSPMSPCKYAGTAHLSY